MVNMACELVDLLVNTANVAVCFGLNSRELWLPGDHYVLLLHVPPPILLYKPLSIQNTPHHLM